MTKGRPQDDSFLDELEDLTSLERGILLLLYAPGETQKTNEPIHGPTSVVKQVFMMGQLEPIRELGSPGSFEPAQFGAFSEAVEAAGDELAARDLIALPLARGATVRLTSEGLSRAREEWDRLTQEQQGSLRRIKRVFNSMRPGELLAAVYGLYPDTATFSQVKEEVHASMRDRLSSAIKLYEEWGVSMSKGAEVAGLSVEEFEDALVTRGIPITLSRAARDLRASADELAGQAGDAP